MPQMTWTRSVKSPSSRNKRTVTLLQVEDLYRLLQTVVAAQPGVTGVSVGAILSDYQRVRVESVCLRLGLTPLAYLWRRDQSRLLGEMVEAGVQAVLIKVRNRLNVT